MFTVTADFQSDHVVGLAHALVCLCVCGAEMMPTIIIIIIVPV